MPGPMSLRNVISGNQSGLLITGGNSRFNVVPGNFIGTDVTVSSNRNHPSLPRGNVTDCRSVKLPEFFP